MSLSLIAFYCEIIFRAKEMLFLGYAIKKTRLPFHLSQITFILFFCPDSFAELLLVSNLTIILTILRTHHHHRRYNHHSYNEQGWRSDESTRLPPMWPGFKSRRRSHMWVEFGFGSLPCSDRFSPGTPVFPSPCKPTLSNSNSIWNARTRFSEFL